MTIDTTWIKEALDDRVKKGIYRYLNSYLGLVDFCSNDYLGISKSKEFSSLKNRFLKKFDIENQEGATGSRLISGNSSIALETEKFISTFHRVEAALIYSTGYAANVGLLSAIAKRGDTIISDEHIHASLIDGVRLSNAKRIRFEHNNLIDLENKLKKTEGRCFVVVESVYSMDGDISPLIDISNLCDKHNAYLIVDEAHAIGVYGDKGEGLVSKMGLENKVWVRVVTFGKAMGTHGAAVLGSKLLIDFLINFSRSFIYSTALPPDACASIFSSYQLVKNASNQRELLSNNIRYFKKAGGLRKLKMINSNSPIQGVYVDGNKDGKNKELKLREQGLACKAILSPTVPEGKERLRISLHSYNTFKEIDLLVNTLSQ